MNYKLSDQIIAEVSRLLQVALLTGTDVVDNLRLLELQDDPDQEGVLLLSESYVDNSERNVNRLVEAVKELSGENEK
jgi:hypothetical protein